MTDFFDDSHVTDMGPEGSAGPSVSVWDMVQQGFRQQYRVDSQRALDEELRTRWAESLQGLRAVGQNFNAPADPLMYRGYARFVREGTPVTTPTIEGEGYGARINYDLQQPHPEFEEIRRANEAIRHLNNPQIKSFEQILEEVSAMQHGVEMETASMSERGGALGIVGELIGAIGGSFTIRDPLNIVTAPFGAGRTVAMRIAADMGIAAGVVTATEFGDVAPNRALAGLPERNPFFNIAAATLGAGIIRGGIEGVGYGIRRLRGRPTEDIDFNLRDSQLQQMFEARADSPTARAGAQALDDMIFVERNNPYGEGQAANARFMTELQQIQRVMGGEPMTAIARVLPPMPFEYIQKAADFEIVREQAPLVYARMEAAQERVDALNAQIEQQAALRDLEVVDTRGQGRYFHGARDEVPNLTEGYYNPANIYGGMDTFYTTDASDIAKGYGRKRENARVYEVRERSPVTFFDMETPQPVAFFEQLFGVRADDIGFTPASIDEASMEGQVTLRQIMDEMRDTSASEGISRDEVQEMFDTAVFNLRQQGFGGMRHIGGLKTGREPHDVRIFFDAPNQLDLVDATPAKQLPQAKVRKVANEEYQAAYRAVEAEATRLYEAQARVEAIQQRESVHIFADATYGRPFNWSMLQHDHVQARVDAINAFNDTLDEKAVAAFVRQMEGEEGLGREAWLTEDGRVDIGLKQPVDPDFRVATDDGDISVADAMRDLQDDADLDDAMRTCLL